MPSEPVIEIVQKYLTKVKRSGGENIMAVCPFHKKADGSSERNPSFAMSTVNGLWFCHGCKSRGNLRTFLRDVGVPVYVIEHNYKRVLEEVAKRVPRPPDPLKPNILKEEPIQEALLGLFDKCPLDLANEGFSDEILQTFKIGFDDAHMRITFPLRDIAGRLIGISGRAVVDGDNPRYKVYDDEYKVWNLPPRMNFNKSEVLWNGHELYPASSFGGLDFLVLVEGFKACMWLAQAGIKNVCALLGSYMSAQQRWILERMGVPVYLMLDNDEAGWKGTEYVAPLLAKSLSVKVVEYEAEQPSDLMPDAVHQALSQAQDYHLWAINQQETKSSWVQDHSVKTKRRWEE